MAYKNIIHNIENISDKQTSDLELAEKLSDIINLTRWVKLNDLNFDIINWSVKDKFIDILH